jgi:hypothetical protein
VIFLDTSALVKRYVDEPGAELVQQQLWDDTEWAASILARTEAQVTICHRGEEGRIGSPSQRRLAGDWDRFLAVPIDAACLSLAMNIGCAPRIRTLDAIHVAAALRLPRGVRFLTFDQRQAEVARALGLEVVAT